jgi:hypothetical protein
MMNIKAKIAIACVAAYILFQFWAFTQVPESAIYFGSPTMPDVRMGGYTPDDLRMLMTQIGPEGRETYLVAQRRIDLTIPALGMAMFVMSLWALGDGLVVFGKTWSTRRALAFACIGLIGPLFDFSENALVAAAMRAGPEMFDAAGIQLSSLCTQLKYTFIAITIALIVVLASLRWWQSRTRSAALV